jgi:hypothetical protein
MSLRPFFSLQWAPQQPKDELGAFADLGDVCKNNLKNKMSIHRKAQLHPCHFNVIKNTHTKSQPIQRENIFF